MLAVAHIKNATTYVSLNIHKSRLKAQSATHMAAFYASKRDSVLFRNLLTYECLAL